MEKVKLLLLIFKGQSHSGSSNKVTVTFFLLDSPGWILTNSHTKSPFSRFHAQFLPSSNDSHHKIRSNKKGWVITYLYRSHFNHENRGWSSWLDNRLRDTLVFWLVSGGTLRSLIKAWEKQEEHQGQVCVYLLWFYWSQGEEEEGNVSWVKDVYYRYFTCVISVFFIITP